MMQIRLRPWEIDALLRLDRVWLMTMSEKGHPFEDVDDSKPAPRPGVRQISLGR